MSDTPNAADDCMKLLDADYAIVMFKNEMGSYTAVAVKSFSGGTWEEGLGFEVFAALQNNEETDDFTPSQVLHRLTEKLTTGRIA